MELQCLHATAVKYLSVVGVDIPEKGLSYSELVYVDAFVPPAQSPFNALIFL